MSSAENTEEKVSTAPTIDQVRELLFGQEQRTFEAQLAEIRAEADQTRRELEDRIAGLESELTRALEKSDAFNDERISKIGEVIQRVGKDIGALSKS